MTVVYGDGGFGFTRQLSEIEIEEYEYVPSRRRLNTVMLKAGAVIQQSGGFSIREASPDAAIYKRGFVISGRIFRRSTKDTGSAFKKHKKRCKGKMPKPFPLPKAAWINKPENDKAVLL